MKSLYLILNLIFIPTLLASELNSVFSEGVNLTDEQVTQSKDFVHQGIKDKVYTEGCKDLKNCQVEDDNGIEKIIGQVYSTALPAILSQFKSETKAAKSSETPEAKPASLPGQEEGSISQTAKDDLSEVQKTADTKEATKEKPKEDSTDWCIIGAMGYEMFSMVFQNKLQNKGSKSAQEIPDTQLRSLVNLRETHKARKKSATYQATAYGAVTACYVGMLATSKLTMNWQTGVKLGGAALLTTLYMKKASKHDKLAGKVQKVIDALPKSGACNPWTQSSCFCQEASSKELYPSEYQEVCILNDGDFNTPKVAMGCAAKNNAGTVTYDEQCRCKQTNSCVSVRVNGINPSLSGATNLMSQMSSGYELLNSDYYDEAKLNAYSTQAAAMGSKIAKKITNPDSKPIALSKEQLEVAKELAGLVTPELAAQIATAKPDYPKNSIASSENASLTAAKAGEAGLTAKAVKGGYKQGSASNNSRKKSEPGFVMPNLLGNKANKLSNVEVMNFAEKAMNNADVNNSPDTPIFDIISNRYRHTWKRLDEKAQLVE